MDYSVESVNNGVDNLINEINQLQTALDKACVMLANITGSCPKDREMNYDINYCDLYCGNVERAECFKKSLLGDWNYLNRIV
jgi:hypothetical protein